MAKIYVLQKVDPETYQPYDVVAAFVSINRAFHFLKKITNDTLILNTYGVWTHMYTYHCNPHLKHVFLHEDNSYRFILKEGDENITYKLQLFED